MLVPCIFTLEVFGTNFYFGNSVTESNKSDYFDGNFSNFEMAGISLSDNLRLQAISITQKRDVFAQNQQNFEIFLAL